MHQNLIFDVGAFEGQDTELYLKKGFSVVAVEANPDFAATIRERHKDAIRDGLLTVVCAAVSESADPARFFIYEYGQWSSVHKIKPGNPVEILVQSIQPFELFRTFGVPYYLKVDIEGSDMLLIRTLRDLRDGIPSYVSFEIGPEVLEGLAILSDLGYKRFKLVEQCSVSAMKLPFPAKEGRFVEYEFSTANSGPFGEETSGIWKAAEQIRKEIQEIDWAATVDVRGEAWKVWYDLHAGT
jgi:FkbM family methyltransferase